MRTNGGGPRGGKGGSTKGPLRKIVRHRRLYTVAALPKGVAAHWSNWQVLLETEDYLAASNRMRGETSSNAWAETRFSTGGWEEVLECGHAQLPVRDMIGQTNAERRRCAKCKKEGRT